MRGILGPLAVAALAATTLTLTACGDGDSSAAITSAAKPTTVPAMAAQPLPGQEVVQCGSGPNGLAVVTFTTKGADFCPTALSVATSYVQERTKKSEGDVAIEVADMRWVCGERQGDPNPFEECASQNESADKVRMLS
ncbi:hypothetical protein AB0L82_20430 [Nocardia sp. NPDC052001]|uniref:hypothetical protein n=1 Tax=Nocardia sp. NPDC052001 TaxID=3154853 RepID=UPI003439950F